MQKWSREIVTHTSLRQTIIFRLLGGSDSGDCIHQLVEYETRIVLCIEDRQVDIVYIYVFAFLGRDRPFLHQSDSKNNSCAHGTVHSFIYYVFEDATDVLSTNYT